MGRKLLFCILVGASFCSAYADELKQPSPDEARDAVAKLFGDPAIEKVMKAGSVKLGTCLPMKQPPHPGQISCTFAMVSGAGSSESQADFYPAGRGWVAAPTDNPDLPFPDPKLR